MSESELPAGGAVNHPPHYNKHPSGVECIDIIEWLPFNLGNAVKYVWRAGEKGNEIQDLEKARWYLEREIDGGVRRFCDAGLAVYEKSVIRHRVLCQAAKVTATDEDLLGCLLAVVIAASDLSRENKSQYFPLLRTATALIDVRIALAQAKLDATGARGSE